MPDNIAPMTGTEPKPLPPTALREGAAIRRPELLQIGRGGARSYGAHQEWYSSWIKRMSGCGPTAASNLLWYLSATRPERCGKLFEGDGGSRAGMLSLMEEVWRYVTPGMRGVDKASTLTEGALRYGAERGVALGARVLEIPSAAAARPGAEQVEAFLEAAFSDDLPVAFLNLSNGGVRGLDSWHWVTLVSVARSLRAEMYDQGRRLFIDGALWLRATTGGGAFVALEPR